MSSNIYNKNFYKNRHLNTLYSAKKILDLALSYLPSIRSSMDFGCGVGTWLYYLKDNNIAITGVDGPWVPAEYLVISPTEFRSFNIAKSLADEQSDLWKIQKHNLVISLEVAEHIEANLSDKFIEFITSHGDYILFSAAIPGQTGDGHVNEQWPSYWSTKFAGYDFELYDLIRPHVWDDDRIPFWYRQNCFLGARKGLFKISSSQKVLGKKFDIVHPQQFELIQRPHLHQKSLFDRIKGKLIDRS